MPSLADTRLTRAARRALPLRKDDTHNDETYFTLFFSHCWTLHITARVMRYRAGQSEHRRLGKTLCHVMIRHQHAAPRPTAATRSPGAVLCVTAHGRRLER